MMYTRAAFYATEPSNAAVYAPVEACGAHEWSCIVHGWRAFAATQPPTQRLEDIKTTLTKTIEAATAEQFKPPVLLSMRLRGGAAEGESGQESGEESGDEGGRDADAFEGESDASGDGSGDESADEDASDVDSSGNVDGLINDAEEEEAEAEEEDDDDEEEEEAMEEEAAVEEELDPSGILPTGTARAGRSRKPDRYMDENHAALMLKDVPAHEREAAIDGDDVEETEGEEDADEDASQSSDETDDESQDEASGRDDDDDDDLDTSRRRHPSLRRTTRRAARRAVAMRRKLYSACRSPRSRSCGSRLSAHETWSTARRRSSSPASAATSMAWCLSPRKPKELRRRAA